MFLKSLNRIRKTIGFRLALWYSAIFLLSFLILFVFAYLYLSSSIRNYDRENIRAELNECATQFQKGGIDALKTEVELEKHASGGRNLFFVRLGGPNNETIFLNFPDQWTGFGRKQIEDTHLNPDREWLNLKIEGDVWRLPHFAFLTAIFCRWAKAPRVDGIF